MQLTLHWIDLSIIALYFVIVLLVGFFVGRRDKDLDAAEFFVAGRKLGWLAIGASLFASNISSEHLIGLSADGFRTGLAVGNYEWGAVIILLILATVFVPFYIGSKINTIPEFLEKRFGVGARVFLSLLTIVANILVRISVALFAAGIVMQQMFGVPFWTAVIVLSIITAFYTVFGGLRAVVYTDVLQTVILLTGTALLTYIALDEVGGWATLRAGMDASMFDMVKPANDPEMPWPGLLLGVPVLGIWYWCTDQVIAQRVLGAKSMNDARMGSVFAAALKILPVFLFVLPGLCGRVLFPDVEPNAIFPTMVTHLLPIGIKGLVSAALLAALMSSIDSTLNSTGTLISLDFYKRFWPHVSGKKALLVGQITTVFVMIFGIAWVTVVARAESLFQYLQQVNAAISPPIAASFLVGIFWRRANYTGVMVSYVAGLILGITLLAAEPFSFLISAAITFVFSVIILVVVSLMTKAPTREQVENLTWKDVKKVVGTGTTKKQLRTFRICAALLIATMIYLWTTFA